MIDCIYTMHMDAEKNNLQLHADACISFNHSDFETIHLGTPKCWDETILQRIEIDSYSIIHICGKLVLHGQYNAVTDYGKIWKLFDNPKGIFDDSYASNRGKVYFGILQGNGRECFLSNISAWIILLPKKEQLDPNIVFSQFKKDKVEFIGVDAGRSLEELTRTVPGSIAFLYSRSNGGSLYISGTIAQNIFLPSDLREWPTHNPELLYRKGL